MKGIITNGSKNQLETPVEVPARQLYLGPYVEPVASIADEGGFQLFFLSAVHGIVSANTPLEPYHRELRAYDSEDLVPVVSEQLEKLKKIKGKGKLEGLDSYFGPMPQMWRYPITLQIAAELAGIDVTPCELPEFSMQPS